ncbi:glycerol operon regulatory protein [Arthrobacter sp. Hiyo8]|nr:glycerol operon regulatory protein [Arthrobacter sp. Hiyo8]
MSPLKEPYSDHHDPSRTACRTACNHQRNPANGDSKGASVLENAIAVLRSFTAEEPLLGVTEIAGRIGLHKSTVSRILATFEQEHLVERDPESRRFRLGLG